MKVAYFVAEYHRFTGSQRQLLKLVKQLPKYGVEPLAVFPGVGPCLKAFREAGIAAFVLPAPPALDVWGKALLRMPRRSQGMLLLRYVIPYSYRLAVALRNAGAGLLHFNTGRGLLLGGYVPRFRGVPVVLHVRGRIQAIGKLLWYVCEMLAQKLVVISPTLLSDMSWLGRRRSVVVAEGVDPGWGELAAKNIDDPVLASSEGKFIIATFASVTPFKGYHHLMEAARILNGRYGAARLAFWAIGAANPYADEEIAYVNYLRSVVRKYELMNWHFLGWRDNPYPYYRRACVVVLPSVEEEVLHLDGKTLKVVGTEGFGETLLEAQYLGKPVIAARNAGTVDQVVDGLNGFLVPPGDPEALASAISRLVQEPALALEMGERARKFVLERFPPGNTANGVLKVYDELLRGKKGSR